MLRGVRVNNTLVHHAAFLAADTLPRVLIFRNGMLTDACIQQAIHENKHVIKYLQNHAGRLSSVNFLWKNIV